MAVLMRSVSRLLARPPGDERPQLRDAQVPFDGVPLGSDFAFALQLTGTRKQEGLDEFGIGQRDPPDVETREQRRGLNLGRRLVPDDVHGLGQVLVEVDRCEGHVIAALEPLPDARERAEDVEEVNIVLALLRRRVVQVGSTAGPRLVLQRVLRAHRRQVLMDEAKDQQERCEPLLAVDKLPLTVVAALCHHWLQKVPPPGTLADVIEEPGDLLASPAIPPLVTRNKELPDDVADEHGPQLGPQSALHGPTIAPFGAPPRQPHRTPSRSGSGIAPSYRLLG